MITLRILLSPGRRGRIVDASGRAVPQPVPAPVIGSAEPLRIILLDPSTLDPADPYGFDTGAPLRLTISGDWDPATIPVYCTNALERTGVGTYDLADPSGTRTAEALALLGVLAERLCAWELTAYGGDPATEADWAHPLSVVQFDAPLRQRADSLGGDPAEAPSVDLRGPAGPAGPAGSIGPTGPQGPKGDPQTPSDATPQMDGTGAAGTATAYARGDHQHPGDTAKVSKSGDTMTGTLTVTDGADGQTNVAAGSVRVVSQYSQTAYSAGAITDPTTGKTRLLPVNNGTLALQEGIAPAFSASSNYAVGDYCTHEGLLYKCTTAVATAGAWNAANWTSVTVTGEMGSGGSSYYEIEYLESTGTQYIDTGVTAGVGVRVVAEVEWDSLAINNTIFGSSRNDTSPNTDRFFILVAHNSASHIALGADGSYFYPNNSAVSVSVGTRYVYDYTLTASSATLLINGNAAISETGAFSFGSNRSIYIFARNDVRTAAQFSSIKLYSLKIYSGNTLVRDFVPVRSGFDGALLDRVSGAFFPNGGTGGFLLGQDVNPRVPTDSPAFTGTPTAPTAATGTNTTQVATTAFVQAAIVALRAELDLT